MSGNDVPSSVVLTDDQKRERLTTGRELHFLLPSAGLPESDDSKAARTVSARWIEELARSRSIAVSIHIENAIIAGSLSPAGVQFQDEVCMTCCTFTSKVDFSFAVFSRSATFSGSEFIADAKFINTDFRGDTYFDTRTTGERLRFHGAVRFDDAQFATNVCFYGTEFNAKTVFSGMKTRGSAVFASDAKGNSATFLGAAHFDRAKVGRKLDLRGATFHEHVDLSFMTIGELDCRSTARAQTDFRGTVNCTESQIEGDALFTAVHFQRNADFSGMRVAGGALFSSQSTELRVRFGAEVSFWNSRLGFVDFRGAEFVGEASFIRA